MGIFDRGFVAGWLAPPDMVDQDRAYGTFDIGACGVSDVAPDNRKLRCIRSPDHETDHVDIIGNWTWSQAGVASDGRPWQASMDTFFDELFS